MGHITRPDDRYDRLQRHLDRYVTGAPPNRALLKILQLLYRPEEVDIALKVPFRPRRLKDIAVQTGLHEDELLEKLTSMSRRGLVFDIKKGDEHYFTLAPVVIGFFELTFMRTGGDLPMRKLAKLFNFYMGRSRDFSHAVFGAETQVGRTLIHEEALDRQDTTEILDWERASAVIKSASRIAVSACSCRHKATHLDKACDRPLKTCLSLNGPAGMLVDSGHAEPVSTGEALRILEQSKEMGMAQTGDNVKRNMSYICNCCSCCCGMVSAIRAFDIRGAIVTSNWVAVADSGKCKGCGKCGRACITGAIGMVENTDNGKPRKRAAVERSLCLGCGVCYSACKNGAITMKAREQRVITPGDMFDRIVAMAVERGKLADMIFDDPTRLSHRAIGRVLSVIEHSPPYKAMMAVKPLRSAFINTIAQRARSATGDIL